VLLILTLILAPVQAGLTQPLDSATNPNGPVDRSAGEVTVSGPSVDTALDRASDLDKALVVDKVNSNWVTRYGTEAGAELPPPRQPDTSAATS
jgi:hypothetical protein